MSEKVTKIDGAWYRKMKLAGKHKPKPKPAFVKRILKKQKEKARLRKKFPQKHGVDSKGLFHGSKTESDYGRTKYRGKGISIAN